MQAFGVRVQGGRQLARELLGELQLPGVGDVPEGALDIIPQIAESDFCHIDHHRAGFDLGQVENVVDQGEEIIARGMNGPGKFHLFFGQVPVFVPGKLIGQDEQAVEGSAQLVRHVGQELGLVF